MRAQPPNSRQRGRAVCARRDPRSPELEDSRTSKPGRIWHLSQPSLLPYIPKAPGPGGVSPPLLAWRGLTLSSACSLCSPHPFCTAHSSQGAASEPKAWLVSPCFITLVAPMVSPISLSSGSHLCSLLQSHLVPSTSHTLPSSPRESLHFPDLPASPRLFTGVDSPWNSFSCSSAWSYQASLYNHLLQESYVWSSPAAWVCPSLSPALMSDK